MMFWSIKIRKRIWGLVIVSICLIGVLCSAVPGKAQQTMQSENGISLPILMFHGILKDESRLGEYVVSADTLEGDFRYLQEHGYQSVTVADLIAYVEEGTPLPEKPIMVTFDDGYYNNYLYAYPLAKKYGFKIVISPIGRYTDEYSEANANHENYSHVTWDQIQEMMESGMVEIQNHSYNLHGTEGRLGAKKLPGESDWQYEELLKGDLGKFQEKMKQHTGVVPQAFVYPFGGVSYASIPILKEMGFQATLTCEEKTNLITQNPESLFSLGRYLRPPWISSEDFFSGIGVF